MENEALTKKIIIALIIIATLSLVWAVGANSRKKVETKKNLNLNKQVEQLTLANTVTTEDLKKTRNELAETKKSEHNIKVTLADEQIKNQSLMTKLQDYERIAKELSEEKKTNQELRDKIAKMKEDEKEYLKIKSELDYIKAKKARKQGKNLSAPPSSAQKPAPSKNKKSNVKW